MVLDPRIGHGTILERSTDGGTNYDPIASLSEIGELGGDVDDVDVTTLDTPEPVRAYVRGLAEPGELGIVGVWTADPSQFALHEAVFAGLTDPEYFRVTLPGGRGEAEFRGYIGGFRINPQLEDRIEFTARIKITGSWTFTLPS